MTQSGPRKTQPSHAASPSSLPKGEIGSTIASILSLSGFASLREASVIQGKPAEEEH
jgi:hypothetical protein